METISEKLKDGIIETIKKEGIGTIIGITVCSLVLVLIELKLLAVYLFVAAIFAVVFFIFLADMTISPKENNCLKYTWKHHPASAFVIWT